MFGRYRRLVPIRRFKPATERSSEPHQVLPSRPEQDASWLFDAAAELLPFFADYQKKTIREIPVLTLTRVDWNLVIAAGVNEMLHHLPNQSRDLSPAECAELR